MNMFVLLLYKLVCFKTMKKKKI